MISKTQQLRIDTIVNNALDKLDSYPDISYKKPRPKVKDNKIKSWKEESDISDIEEDII